jgi:hypothetical protein
MADQRGINFGRIAICFQLSLGRCQLLRPRRNIRLLHIWLTATRNKQFLITALQIEDLRGWSRRLLLHYGRAKIMNALTKRLDLVVGGHGLY